MKVVLKSRADGAGVAIFAFIRIDCGEMPGRDVIADTVDVLHLIDDARGELVQHVTGDACSVRGRDPS